MTVEIQTVAGGTNQISTISVDVSTLGDTLAFNYDGLGDLSVTATNNPAGDAFNLVAQWNANADYIALGEAMNNGDGTFTVPFLGTESHTFTDNSDGTSVLSENIDQAASVGTQFDLSTVGGGRFEHSIQIGGGYIWALSVRWHGSSEANWVLGIIDPDDANNVVVLESGFSDSFSFQDIDIPANNIGDVWRLVLVTTGMVGTGWWSIHYEIRKEQNIDALLS